MKGSYSVKAICEILSKQKLKLKQVLKCELDREARIFQKVVFAVEKIKYKLLRLFPHVEHYYNNHCDRYYEKLLQELGKENDEALMREIRSMKMAFKKELVTQMNRNYHYNPNTPTQFIFWLESNKRIHKRGIQFNLGAIDAILLGIIFLPGIPITYLLSLMALEFVSLFVNFQCVNLQNYNLNRFHTNMEKLKRYEEKKKILASRKYKHCSEKMHEVTKNRIDLLSVQETIDSMETLEEIQEMKNIVKETMKMRKLAREKVR